jgi:hypothetical protein
MTFDELWEEVWKDTKLPKEAKTFLPQSLSEKTKRQLLNSGKTTTEIAKIIESAVDVINHGSVATIDELVNKFLLGE